MGFSYNGQDNVECLGGYIIAIIPICFFKGLSSISSFLSVILYIMAYIPIIVALQISSDINANMRITYQVTLMIAMVIFFLSDRIKVGEMPSFKTKIPCQTVLFITIIIVIYLLYAFRNNLTFANLGNLYAVREKNDEVIHSGINGYLLLWTQKALIPFLFVVYYACKKRKSRWIAYGLLGLYVPIFMMNAQKATILTPFLIIIIAKLLERPKRFYPIFIWALSLLSILVLLTSDTLLGFSIGSVLFMRTLCICPLLFIMYSNFFLTSPYTYFSHISFVNSITGAYPYHEILGKVVGGDDNNANAFFWTTDGIASCGEIGLIIISIVFFLYLVFLNILPKGNISKTNMMLMFVPSLTALLNSSFFTYFFSHGIFIIYFLILSVKLPHYLKV